VQAVGGSMLNPVAMSIIRNTFDDERERAQAIGIWGGVVGLSMALGPVLGGLLIAATDWRAVFWVNAPIGLLAVALVHRYVPESRAPTARRVDLVGQALVIVGLGTMTYAIIEAGSAGLASPRVLACAAVAVVSLVLFVAYELRREEPLIDPRFFRSIPFSGAALVAVLAFTALGGFLFLTNLYLQGDRGLSPLHAGLYTLPMAAAAFFAAPLSGRLVGTRGGRIPLVVGGAGLAVGSILLTGLTPDTSTGRLITAYLIFGLGFGMVNPPITNTAVSGMPGAQAGVAAAIASTSRLVGLSLGVAISGAVVVAGRTVPPTSVAEPSHPAWWISAACGLAVVLLGFASTSTRALRSPIENRLAPIARAADRA
jgi:EmrB/QacA subfamily drug resistance transporter